MMDEITKTFRIRDAQGENMLILSFWVLRESSFNMARGGGGNEDIETQSLKF